MLWTNEEAGVVARFLVSLPCQDACCEVMTDKVVEGAPVYRCPGCDSEWIELRERSTIVPDTTGVSSVGADAGDGAAPPISGSE